MDFFSLRKHMWFRNYNFAYFQYLIYNKGFIQRLLFKP